jgi:2-(1,2-epoxy-1,2-dihydrophenyl)acetyl-CoA isomerase
VTKYNAVEGLKVASADGVLDLMLDRSDKRNSLNDVMVAGLIDAISEAGRDEAVRVIVLRGAGDHFCGGFDIIARNSEAGDRPRVGSIQRRLPHQAHGLVALIATVQTPVVCVVRGWAAGIGLHLALAADFAIADDQARLWEPFAERGFTPDSGGTWLLPRRVGEVRAREVLLLGRVLTGLEAAEWGMVHRAVPAVDLEDEVASLVGQLASGPTVSLGLTKWLLHVAPSSSFEGHLHDEAMALELSSRSEDFREGFAAYKQKRPPRFTGR